MTRLPSLDGFRAVSILLVIFCHARLLDWFPSALAPIAQQCNVGVTVFFVISGFLITTLLLKEQQKEQTIKLKVFFIRRAFRILPVFVAYIVFIGVYNYFFDLSVLKSTFFHAITFTANFDPNGSWFLGHFWTLAIEEQFYLFWPFVIFFLRPKNLKFASFLLIAYSCIVRVIVYKFKLDPVTFLHPFFAVSDSIFVGALTAIIWQEYPRISKSVFLNNYYLQLVSLSLIVLFLYARARGKLAWVALPFGNTIISVSIMYLILSYIEVKDTLIYKLLNNKYIIHVGVLSYSIYIWQQFFFGKDDIPLLNIFVIKLLAIYLISFASYYFLEQPFINLRRRILQHY